MIATGFSQMTNPIEEDHLFRAIDNERACLKKERAQMSAISACHSYRGGAAAGVALYQPGDLPFTPPVPR
jgi:hypothetical protein